MSADFRYDDPTVYGAWYGRHHAPELLKKSVYGLPELYREAIQKTQLLANPGCYTTCSILALAPLLKEHLVDPESILIDAKSGVSGAGRKVAMATQFCEVEGDVKAYSVGVHRHTSEIEQELGKLYGADITLSFTPHLVPIKRGILATCYAKLTSGKNSGDLVRIYRAFYEKEPFVTLFEESELPQIKDVVGSNRVAIGLTIDQRTKRVVVVSCLDNLIKGAAGQAVQNFNLMNGLPETTGLESVAWYL